MAADLKSKLSLFASTSSDFDNPFDDSARNPSYEEMSIEYGNDDELGPRQPKKNKAKKLSKLERVTQKIDSMMEGRSQYDFDSYLDDIASLDEDTDLKMSLISMGRKYAKDNKMTEDDSEIGKAFSPQEAALKKLLAEIDKDKKDISEDIKTARSLRVKNTRLLSELMETKSNYHNTTLSVLKEISSIKKTEFDLKYKSKKEEGEKDGDYAQSSNAIQKLFGIGHSALLSSIGGSEASSGSIGYDDNFNSSFDESDDVIERKYFPERSEQPMTDGDMYLKYENSRVHYVLLIDPDEGKSVIAEDENGTAIFDYPMPSNINDLKFKIDRNAMTAIDQLQREYVVRYVNSDGADLNSYPESDE